MIIALLALIGSDQALWSRLDDTGSSCASCHTPDGSDLAAFRFTRENLDRRVARHFGGDERAKIVDMLVRRSAFAQLDPMEDRPLQPGGDVLPGATPSAREVAFGAKLEQRLPQLTGPRIDSLESAVAARDELRALDVAALPVGIPFSRLSEDPFNGPAHQSIADWMPEFGVPSTPEFLAARSAYADEPSPERLADLDRIVATFRARSAAQQLSLQKYRALLRYGFRLRTGRAYVPKVRETTGNPYWEIAEIGRINAPFTLADMGYPRTIAADSKRPARLQLTDLRLPWYWLGFVSDPSLLRGRPGGETERGDYFAQELWAGGPYPLHLAFAMSKKLVEQSRGRPFEIQFSFLVLGDRLRAGEPTDPAHRKRFRQFTANAFRMSMWLAIAEKSPPVLPQSQALQVRLMGDYLAQIGQAEPELVNRALAQFK